MKHIKDTLGRKVRFSYADPFETFSVPQIDRIWIEDDPQGREVRYDYTGGGPLGLKVPLPLLEKATDVGSREYAYDYDDIFLFSGEAGIKVNILALLADCITGGAFSAVASFFGLSSVTIHAGVQALWTFPMEKMTGWGLGTNTMDYETDTLGFLEIDPADFLFGLIPTAVDTTIGLKQLFFTKTLERIMPFTGQRLSENYTFDYVYAGEKQYYSALSSKDDGRIREVYRYAKIKKRRQAWSTWSDYLADILTGGFVTDRPYDIEYIPLETSRIVYDSVRGNLIETHITKREFKKSVTF